VDAAGVAGELVMQAYDWDKAGSHELIGEAVISRQRLKDVVRAKETWESLDSYIVQKDGKRVLGSDRQQTTLTIKMAVSRPHELFDGLEMEADAQGPRQLSLTVVKCRNLPKCDLMGTCDAFVEVIFEGTAQKTKVIKNSYSPDFHETFNFDIPEAGGKCSQDAILRVFDWNLTSSSEVVGECRIPASRLSDIVKAKIGWEGEETLELSHSGRPVMGHNQFRTEVTARLRVLKAAKAFENLVLDSASSGSRRLHVTVVSSKHLPKMDTMGTIDPYCVLVFQETEMRTPTIKDTYTPEWNESFIFEVHHVEKACDSDFRLTVMDWDATSKDEEVGSFTIPGPRMSEILRAKIGWEGTDTFVVYHEGKPVIGNDKEMSEVTIKVRMAEVPKAFASLVADEQAHGQRRLKLTLVSANHLPKMDMIGTIDPYAVISFEGMELRSKTVKNTYSPQWEEAFHCNIGDVHKGCSDDLRVTLMDWDAASKDDEVGSFTIPASRMSEIVRATIGSDATDTFNLYLGGKKVVGQDKLPSEVTLSMCMEEVPKAFAMLQSDSEAAGQRRIKVTLVSAKHLPKVRFTFCLAPWLCVTCLASFTSCAD
jgi:Ca2+-dependent lipid-binding protein